ncbi:hypothetical protein [Streptomyces sp. NPDC002386]
MLTLVSQPVPAPESALFDLVWGLGVTGTGLVALANPRGILEWLAVRRGRGGKIWRGRLGGGVLAVAGLVELTKGGVHLAAPEGSGHLSVFHRTHGLPPALAAVMVLVMGVAAGAAWRSSAFLRDAGTSGAAPRACAVTATVAALAFAACAALGYLAAGLLCWAAGGAAAAGLFLLRGRRTY